MGVVREVLEQQQLHSSAERMTSFIERKVNEICGRWLDGFTKDNVDVSLLQAKITLSDLHFKTVSSLCFEKDRDAARVF